MEIIEFGRSFATVRLTADELALINNALNEVARGVHDLADDHEFATRLGGSREEAKALHAHVHDLLGRASQAPE